MNRRPRHNQSSLVGWIVAIIVLIAAGAAGVYLVQKAMHPGASSNAPLASVAPAALSTSAPADAASVIQHPVSQASSGPASASTAALPSLVDSDASVRNALATLAGGDLKTLLASSQIISRTVATVDALPRHSFGSAYILPLRTPKGGMQTQVSNGAMVITTANGDRYNAYMAVLANTDPHALVAWYKYSYPLFQNAYRELGYPRGYFNDRLIEAIDDMLAAPEPRDPVVVTRSGAHYVFADPSLQSLSNGQKLMIRLGTGNEQQLKAKLRMTRALLTGMQVAH